MMWDEISTYLYLLVAAMIKGNHSNCAQFAALLRLDWLFSRLSNPQSAEGILDVLYCVLTESPEALNMINEGHIKSVISLLEKVGRDPKVFIYKIYMLLRCWMYYHRYVKEMVWL